MQTAGRRSGPQRRPAGLLHAGIGCPLPPPLSLGSAHEEERGESSRIIPPQLDRSGIATQARGAHMRLLQTAAWVPLRNSERPLPPGGKWLGPVDPNEPMMITIYVRPGVGTSAGAPGAMESGLHREHSHHRRHELGEEDGADPAELDSVREFASQAGLDVIELSPARCSVVVWGTAGAIAAAFRVELAHYDDAGKVRRGQIGPIYLPPTIAHIVEEISGLDDGFPDGIASIPS